MVISNLCFASRDLHNSFRRLLLEPFINYRDYFEIGGYFVIDKVIVNGVDLHAISQIIIIPNKAHRYRNCYRPFKSKKLKQSLSQQFGDNLYRWHSHPSGNNNPSVMDKRAAYFRGDNYVIIATLSPLRVTLHHLTTPNHTSTFYSYRTNLLRSRDELMGGDHWIWEWNGREFWSTGPEDSLLRYCSGM